ncbi:MAG: exonuclease domain-containing protein [Clostridiales bacterium]|nr:exonuclease domain-containing protein [Clostridiales bacterium]
MHYIVFDLEFNQDPESLMDLSLRPENKDKLKKYPTEIIQFGAVKLDENFNQLDTFSRLVKPSIYYRVNPFITELTGITTESLQEEATFDVVCNEFSEFSKEEEVVFCVWGMTDLKELYRNITYYNLDEKLLPKRYINIQPSASAYLGRSKKKMLSLAYCVEALGIEIGEAFHNALYDALYTAEILKIIYDPSIKPRRYDPSKAIKHARPSKMILDFPLLIEQFEKMLSRKVTEEEKEIIRLAYHMGKTRQFLKKSDNKNENIPDN